jgi:hypothetical protein
MKVRPVGRPRAAAPRRISTRCCRRQLREILPELALPADARATISAVDAAARPPDFLGTRELDLQVTKDVDLGHAVAMYVRLDLLNVFNKTNYADYNLDYGNTGVPPPSPVTFSQIGNILGTPRMLKLQAGVRF